MRLKIFGIIAAAIFAAGLLGCATMNDVVKAKNDGTVKVYPVTAEQAWEIAKKSSVGKGRTPLRSIEPRDICSQAAV